MGFGDKCCVGGCDNDRRHPEKWLIHSHVGRLSFHKPNNQMIEAWSRQVQTGRKDFAIGKSRKSVVVCSNHFQDGKPTKGNPLPTLFLTPFEHSNTKSPRKRRRLEYNKVTATSTTSKSTEFIGPSDLEPDNNGDNRASDPMEIKSNSIEFTLCTASAQITRDGDVPLHTGIQNTDALRILFEHLLPKAKNMTYWKGNKQTEAERPRRYAGISIDESPTFWKPGPPRKLKLEQELLLVMMRLRLALSVGDLAFRFGISDTLCSSIFMSWVKLMKGELSWLIKWPSKEQTKKTLPKCFEKYYSKVRCIIDCSEVFIETPCTL